MRLDRVAKTMRLQMNQHEMKFLIWTGVDNRREVKIKTNEGKLCAIEEVDHFT